MNRIWVLALWGMCTAASAQCIVRDWSVAPRASTQHAKIGEDTMVSSLEHFEGGLVHAAVELGGQRKEVIRAQNGATYYRGVAPNEVLPGGGIREFAEFGTQFQLPIQTLRTTFPEGPCSVRGATPAVGAPGTVEADRGRLKYDLSFARQLDEGGAQTMSMRGEFHYHLPQRALPEHVELNGWSRLDDRKLIPLNAEDIKKALGVQ